MAPSYANLFMDQIERDLLQRAVKKPTSWWRFINDIFTIWPHGEENLLNFIQANNSHHKTIKFTAEWSSESVTFLDTKVIRDGYSLITDLHIKPTDTHQYLHQRSCHSPHCKNSIACSQALRIHRICSRHTDYLQQAEELKAFLVKRGYDGGRVQRRISKATGRDRDSLLTPSESINKHIVPLVVSFHSDLPNLTCVLQCVIKTSPRLKNALPNPFLVAYRPPKLKDLLVRAAYGQVKQTHTGNSRCRQPRCKTCAHIMGTTICSTTTGKNFQSESQCRLLHQECGLRH